MHLRMYVYFSVCMNIYMYVCLCDAFLASFIYVCYTHACTVYTHVYTYARMYECMYVCIYGCVWMHVCMYLRVIVFLCIYTLVCWYIRLFVCNMTIKTLVYLDALSTICMLYTTHMHESKYDESQIQMSNLTHHTYCKQYASLCSHITCKCYTSHIRNTCEWATSLIRTSHVTRGVNAAQDWWMFERGLSGRDGASAVSDSNVTHVNEGHVSNVTDVNSHVSNVTHVNKGHGSNVTHVNESHVSNVTHVNKGHVSNVTHVNEGHVAHLIEPMQRNATYSNGQSCLTCETTIHVTHMNERVLSHRARKMQAAWATAHTLEAAEAKWVEVWEEVGRQGG